MTEDPRTKVMSHSYILDTKKLLENLKIFIIVLKLCVHMWVLHLNVSAPGGQKFQIPLELVVGGFWDLLWSFARTVY